jgi:hypothetical protein
MKSSKSYMKSVKSHGMHTPHNGGQTAKSFGKGTASPNTDRANAQPVKGNGGHKGGKSY